MISSSVINTVLRLCPRDVFQAGKFEAPFIDRATGLEIEGSEAKVKGDRWKIEIPDVEMVEHLVCLRHSDAALVMGYGWPNEDGELKIRGWLPEGSFPISISVSPAEAGCMGPISYLSAYNTEVEEEDDEGDDEGEHEEEHEDDEDDDHEYERG